MFFEVKDVDRQFYATHLADYLPARIIDTHTHVWRSSFVKRTVRDPRIAQWPERVAADSPIEDLLTTYELMLPRQKVTPVIFGWPERGVDLDQTNGYTAQAAQQRGLPGLLVSVPEWKAEQLEHEVSRHGLLGLKPYLSFAPLELSDGEVTIYDFLPRRQLEVADAHGWIVMLHIPRPGRLKDPVNIEQLVEIERCYPHLRLIVAHIGRAYCREDVGDAFDVLRNTTHMSFDFSANTNGEVMARLLAAVGPKRVLFGSDLPIVRMRMRRICEQGRYINLVPSGLYGDVHADPHMRDVEVPESDRLSFFLYEELLAFRQAAEHNNLDAGAIEDVFYNNAAILIAGAAAGGSTG